MMKIADIRKQSTNDLAKQSTALREEITEMRRRLYSGEVTNVRAIRAKRKDLARVMTVLGEQLSKESI
jgi:large subunit ribosomal protein L29